MTVRLLVNTATTFKGGGVQVAASFLNECRNFRDCQFGVVLGPGLSGIIEKEEFPDNFEFFEIDYRPAQKVVSWRGPGADLDHIESLFRPEVVFTTSGPSYWRPRAPHLMGFNLPHHLYPESPYFTKVLSLAQRLRWRAKSLVIGYYTKRFADAWVVQTDDVNVRLRRWIRSDAVYTVTNTASSAYANWRSAKSRAPVAMADGGREFRILVLSSYYAHKNLEILNSIVAALKEKKVEDIRFVTTLSDADFEKVIVAENRDYIDNVGPKAPDDCPALYLESNALFLPSLLECFSANYVEAMTIGRPIITTNLGFAKTICGDAALYYAPMDAADALRNIRKLKANPDLANELITSGKNRVERFGSAKKRAVAYLEICRNLVASGVTGNDKLFD